MMNLDDIVKSFPSRYEKHKPQYYHADLGFHLQYFAISPIIFTYFVDLHA